MDRQVISIGGSSEKETFHKASNNESFSLDKLRVSCRTGGGISRLHGRAHLSAASLVGEPVLVTMILSPYISGGARRSYGRSVRASPHVRCSHSVGFPSSLPVVASFEWVRDDILKYKSSITSVSSVLVLQCQVKLASPEDSYKIAV